MYKVSINNNTASDLMGVECAIYSICALTRIGNSFSIEAQDGTKIEEILSCDNLKGLQERIRDFCSKH